MAATKDLSVICPFCKKELTNLKERYDGKYDVTCEDCQYVFLVEKEDFESVE